MAMSEEELMALEREGALISQKVVESFRQVQALCAGSEEGSIAILAGYMRIYLAEMPGLDVELLVRSLCEQFVPSRANSWPDRIIARLRGAKGAPS